jgi:hypothetical protein
MRRLVMWRYLSGSIQVGGAARKNKLALLVMGKSRTTPVRLQLVQTTMILGEGTHIFIPVII